MRASPWCAWARHDAKNVGLGCGNAGRQTAKKRPLLRARSLRARGRMVWHWMTRMRRRLRTTRAGVDRHKQGRASARERSRKPPEVEPALLDPLRGRYALPVPTGRSTRMLTLTTTLRRRGLAETSQTSTERRVLVRRAGGRLCCGRRAACVCAAFASPWHLHCICLVCLCAHKEPPLFRCKHNPKSHFDVNTHPNKSHFDVNTHPNILAQRANLASEQHTSSPALL